MFPRVSTVSRGSPILISGRRPDSPPNGARHGRSHRACLKSVCGYSRLSIRGLIVLNLAIGVWLGWIVRCAHIQHDAVAAIQKAGGSVRYDWEWTNGRTIQKREPWWPGWLGNILGID
jgi:hypothetical protein